MKYDVPKMLILALLAGIFLSLTACLVTLPVREPPPRIAPPPPRLATEIPFYFHVIMKSESHHEEAQRPNYTIDTQTPILEGSQDWRVEDFNTLMRTIVQEEVDEFKSWMANMPADPIVSGSFVEVTFEEVSPPGAMRSIIFSIIFYSDGAAHPGHYSRTVTFDLENGSELTLDQLFLPETDYLGIISTYCIDELRRREIGFDEMWMEGAKPTEENYRNWNITAEGLLITFDEYQVAAYAAGPQEIVIPYIELGSVIDPNSPMSEILP